MKSHGHVTPNADGSKARCGGPLFCPICSAEQAHAFLAAKQKMERKMTSGEKVQAVYDLELNAKVDWFWDAGFRVTMGDKINGWREEDTFQTFDDAADWMYEQALRFVQEFRRKDDDVHSRKNQRD